MECHSELSLVIPNEVKNLPFRTLFGHFEAQNGAESGKQ